MEEKYITINDLARILGVTRQAIQKQLQGKIQAGEVSIKEIGKKYLIRVDTLPSELQSRVNVAQLETAQMAKKLTQEIHKDKDINFENDLWSAADKLRGSIDASDYKHIVLGLIFLKYITDTYYQRRDELVAFMADHSRPEYVPDPQVREKMLEEKDLYKSRGIFFIPEIARWEYLRSKATSSDIAKYIDEAMEAIEKDNPEQLTGVLPKSYVRVGLDSHILGELVNIFSRINFDHDIEKEKDLLGRVYEYFLGQFASEEGKRGGEFFTARSIVKVLVEVLEPFENSRVADFTCGSGGMFVQSSKFLQEHHKDPAKISIYGQESNQTTMKLCKMNLAIRGIYGKIELGNTYYDDKFPDLKVDIVIANPPFNAEWNPDRLDEKDPRIHYGTPPFGNANFMWIQHFLHHLTPNGIAGFVMANGALAVGGKEGEIRKRMIEDDLVDIIIACPPKLFYNVSLPVSLWFMTKNKTSGRFRNRAKETLFIDAKDLFEQISRKQVIFNDEQIKKIADTVRAWRGEAGIYENVAGFCKSVTLSEIAENGYVLTPGRYVEIAEEEDDGVSYEEKMSELTKSLAADFAKSRELEDTIRQNLKSLGFEL